MNTNIIRLIAIAAFGILTSACASAAVPSHDAWDKILRKYVNNAGWVDYKGIIKDKAEFETYLALLSSNPPKKDWSSADKEAYWINAYNAFTVKLIIDHYPVKSIKDIGPKHQIVRINTPWQKKFFKIGHKRFKLDKIENQILRKDFKKKSGSVIAFINLYAPVKLKEDADIEYKDYDWSLNEQR